MAERIPPDFDRAWGKSDVVLHALNSEGKELHANKTVLSIFSPYFDALFSGRFAEKDMNSLDMNCDYNAMKEILRNIHQVGVNYTSTGQKQYNAKMLKELYMAGDYYNFPHIRKLCLDQMKERPSVDMAMTAATLDLREIVMDILMRLEKDEVTRFLGKYSVGYLFTKKEVLRLYENIVGIPLPRSSKKSSTKPLNLEEVTEEIWNPRIDLTKPWEMANVAISTKNSMGRLLYANQSVINMLSTQFKNLSFTPLFLEEEDRSISLTTVDAEYTTMKEILSVLHHCGTHYQNPGPKIHPAMLHSMYRAASKDQLDIPMIRDFCIAKLLEQESLDCFDVLRDLNNSEPIFLRPPELRDLVYRETGHLSYRKGEEVVVVTPSQDKSHFDMVSVMTLIDESDLIYDD